MTTWNEKYASVAGAGAHDGTSAANAWTMAEATANVSAGDRVNCAAGTYIADDSASSAVMDLDVAGTIGNWIEWRGYTTTIDDFSIGDAPPVVLNAGTNALASAIDATTVGGAYYNKFKGFRMTGGSSHGVNGSTTADNLVFIGCKIDANGGRGIQADNVISVIGCEFTGNTTNSLDVDAAFRAVACIFHNEATTNGICQTQETVAVGCLLYNNGNGKNFRTTSGTASAYINNSFDGDNQASSVGIFHSGLSSIPNIVLNNIFYDLGTGVGFNNAGIEEIGAYGHNLLYSNTDDYDIIENGMDDVVGTSDPFTNSASSDFSLKSGSEALEKGLDAWALHAQTQGIDIGAIQDPAGAGGGGASPLAGRFGGFQ